MDNLGDWKKKCNFCGEEIAYSSRRCPYCGSLVGDNAVNNVGSGPNVDINNAGMNNTTSYNEPAFNEPGTEYAGTQQEQANQDNYQRNNEAQYRVNQNEADKSTAPAVQDINAQPNPANFNMGAEKVPITYNNTPYNRPDMKAYNGYQANPQQDNPLGNGVKVFLTVISTIPWVGQLVGIIAAIVFMNSEHDKDRKSFGVSLLIASLVLFVVISCFGCLAAMAFSKS